MNKMMIVMEKEELLELQKEIETAKSQKLKLQGTLESLTASMKKEFGCSTVEEADAQVEKLEQSILKIKTDIKDRSLELEKKIKQMEYSTLENQQ